MERKFKVFLIPTIFFTMLLSVSAISANVEYTNNENSSLFILNNISSKSTEIEVVF